ncbi:hypothetical protein OAE26_02155 [Synechococcus sp. AH-551-E05]|nr:hypothetical protein [Synechococcus sp. AH-551-E05]
MKWLTHQLGELFSLSPEVQIRQLSHCVLLKTHQASSTNLVLASLDWGVIR